MTSKVISLTLIAATLALTPAAIRAESENPNTWAIVGVEVPTPSAPHEVTTEAAAIKLAEELLIMMKASWGKPIGIQRTVSGFYRIEFGVDNHGVERVVLVNDKTGHATFPLPR